MHKNNENNLILNNYKIDVFHQNKMKKMKNNDNKEK
jgi:hypothetical protein